MLSTLRDREWIEKKMIDYELRCAWFDIVETLRKLFLTGLAVLLGQGTMLQLVLSVLLAAAMLAITATLRPYKNLEDDSLSIICQSPWSPTSPSRSSSTRCARLRARGQPRHRAQADRAFYVQQLRALKAQQDAAEDTLALLLIVVALPFLIAVTVVFEQMIKGMRKADEGGGVDGRQGHQESEALRHPRDCTFAFAAAFKEAKLSVDAPAPLPSPPVFEPKGVPHQHGGIGSGRGAAAAAAVGAPPAARATVATATAAARQPRSQATASTADIAATDRRTRMTTTTSATRRAAARQRETAVYV